MGNKYYVENPKKFILEFLEDQFGKDLELEEKLEKLREFSFWDISEKSKYRNSKYYDDGDCINVVYAIDWCLWESALKETVKNYSFTMLLNEDYFSGETLNTFRTLFTNDENKQNLISKLWGEKDFNKNVIAFDKNFKEDFYHVYQKLGNFSLLPKFGKISGETINQKKGTSPEIKDYLYPFMENLKEAYKVKDNPDYKVKNGAFQNDLIQLLKANEDFFKVIGKFDDFVTTFMVDGWEQLELPEYLKSSELTEKNIHIAKEYVEKATTFINNRTKKIIEKLKPILKDSNN